jgi:hypothetical protein
MSTTPTTKRHGVSELTDFLKARIEEDEQTAREAQPGPWLIGNAVDPTQPCNVHTFPTVRKVAENLGWLDAEHIARHNPARVRRQVAAARRVLARHKPAGPDRYRQAREELNCEGCGWEGEHADPVTENIDECPELRDLASIYEDAPGWQERWHVS